MDKIIVHARGLTYQTTGRDLSMCAARRSDSALTVMIINLALEAKAKALRFGDQTQIQTEMWLLDPEHWTENMGLREIFSPFAVPAPSMMLLILEEWETPTARGNPGFFKKSVG